MTDRSLYVRRRNLVAKVLRELVRERGGGLWPDYKAVELAVCAKLATYGIAYDEYGPAALHDGIAIVHLRIWKCHDRMDAGRA